MYRYIMVHTYVYETLRDVHCAIMMMVFFFVWCAVPSTHSLPVDALPPPLRAKGRPQRRLYKPYKQGYGRPNHLVMVPPPRRNIPLGEHTDILYTCPVRAPG